MFRADLAQRINFNTAIGLDWLLTDDVTKPPVTDDGESYTKSAFEERQAALLAPARTGDDACVELWDVWTLFARHVKLLSILYAEAYKKGKVGIVAYKSRMAVADIVKTTLKLPDAVAEKYEQGTEREAAPERLDEVADTLRAFAAETYEELKRKLKQRKEPLSPAARTFLRDFEQRLRRAKK